MNTCIPRARIVTPTNFIRGRRASVPAVAKVLDIREKTPIGAIHITKETIFITIALSPLATFSTSSDSPLVAAMLIPVNRAKTIIGSISPFARAITGFLGTIFRIISTTPRLSPTLGVMDTTLERSKPTPGLNIFPSIRARVTAIPVVAM